MRAQTPRPSPHTASIADSSRGAAMASFISTSTSSNVKRNATATFVLEVSDDKMTAEAAALAYKGLLRVEQSFRTLKHGVDVRPVYHRLDKRIRAHVSLCMLAYLLERVVEIDTGVPFTQIKNSLMRIRAVELKYDQQTVQETSTVPSELRALFSKLKLAAPPKILGAQTP